MIDFDGDIDVFFDEFAKEYVYEHDGTQFTVHAIVTKQKKDNEDDTYAGAEAVIFISETELEQNGITQPEMYDTIGSWIVQSSRYAEGIWEIFAYANVKINPK